MKRFFVSLVKWYLPVAGILCPPLATTLWYCRDAIYMVHIVPWRAEQEEQKLEASLTLSKEVVTDPTPPLPHEVTQTYNLNKISEGFALQRECLWKNQAHEHEVVIGLLYDGEIKKFVGIDFFIKREFDDGHRDILQARLLGLPTVVIPIFKPMELTMKPIKS